MVKQSTLSRSAHLLLESGSLSASIPVSRLVRRARSGAEPRALQISALPRAAIALSSSQRRERRAHFRRSARTVRQHRRADPAVAVRRWQFGTGTKPNWQALAPGGAGVAGKRVARAWRWLARRRLRRRLRGPVLGRAHPDRHHLAARATHPRAMERLRARALMSPRSLHPPNRRRRSRCLWRIASWRGKFVERAIRPGAMRRRRAVSLAMCAVALHGVFLRTSFAFRTAPHGAREAREQRSSRACATISDIARGAGAAPPVARLTPTATAHPQILAAGAKRMKRFRGSVCGPAHGAQARRACSLIVDFAHRWRRRCATSCAAIEAAPHLCAALPEIAGAGRFEVRATVAAPGAACAARSERHDRARPPARSVRS